MTSSAHSVLNTWLLSIVTILLMGVVALMGWGLSTIVDLSKTVSGQVVGLASANEHAKSSDDRSGRIEGKVEALSDKVDSTAKELREGQAAIGNKIELALRDNKGLPSRQ